MCELADRASAWERKMGSVQALVPECVEVETDPFVIRVAMQALTSIHASLPEGQQACAWADMVDDVLSALHEDAESLAVRRWAAHGLERLWCQRDPDRVALRESLERELKRVPSGKRRIVRRASLPTLASDAVTLGRVLAVMGQDDFGWDVCTRSRTRLTFTRGHRFGSR